MLQKVLRVLIHFVLEHGGPCETRGCDIGVRFVCNNAYSLLVHLYCLQYGELLNKSAVPASSRCGFRFDTAYVKGVAVYDDIVM